MRLEHSTSWEQLPASVLSRNSKIAPRYMLVSDVAPGMKRMLSQVEPSPFTNNKRADPGDEGAYEQPTEDPCGRPSIQSRCLPNHERHASPGFVTYWVNT